MKKRGLRRWFRDLGLRGKLLLCFFTLIMIPCLLISVCAYTVSSRIIEGKTSRYSHDILRQTTHVLDSRVNQLESISFNIFVDTEVQGALRAVNGGAADDYAVSRYRNIVESSLAAQILYHDEIRAARVIALDGTVFRLDKKLKPEALPVGWREAALRAKGGAVWMSLAGDDNVVMLARSVYSIQSQAHLGELVMLADEAYLSDVLANTQSFMNGRIYAVDGDGIIAIDPDGGQVGCAFPCADEGIEAYSFSKRMLDGEQQYLAMSEPMTNGWRVVSVVPVAVYSQEIQDLRLLIFAIGLSVFLLSVLFAWQIARGVSKPMRTLTDAMSSFGEGNLGVRCAQDARDEVGLCATAFNRMAENINQLVGKVYQEQLMKRDAELKSLRMQINPHFLYNTLETINWMARSGGNDDVGVMAKSLGDLMRSTINGKDSVRLSEEIASLHNYVKIQNYRYGDKFTFVTDIAPDTLELYVPKLILQPLVENAICHGIEPAFGNGTVKVTARRADGVLELAVSDDGVGMDEATIERLTRGADGDDGSIGLRNVIKRIGTLYGEPHGLTISSELGEGTTITIRLPEIHKSEEDGQHENGLL